MANYTEKAIVQTFEEMLAEMPFEKITVTAIVSRCEISSNTFYYHYHDIFDLLDSWLNIKKDKYLTDIGDDWTAALKAMLHVMQSNPQIVYHIFDSISRDRLERYIFCSVEENFYELVKSRAADSGISGDAVRDIAGFCCYSCLGFILKFVWNRMSSDVDSSVDRLGHMFDGTIEYVARRTAGGD